MMKKRRFILLLCAMMLFSVYACNKNEQDSPKISQMNPMEIENVSAAIQDLSPSGATLLIKDTNATPYIYGEWFCIEEEKNGEWYEMETITDHYSFNEMGYLVNQDNEVKFVMNWSGIYGELLPGSYRILKQADHQYFSIPFSIEAVS